MFGPLLNKLDQLKPQSICVEAAHIYTNETPGEEHLYCAKLGAQVVEVLSQKGFSPVKMLFVDDYHPNPMESTLDLRAYIKGLEQEGFNPDVVIMESALAKPAFCLSRSFNGQSEVREGRLCLRKPNLVLVAEDGSLSCNILDAALYVSKFSMFSFSITVLPDVYKGQQRNVRKVLKALGYERIPLANVYYTAERKVTVGIQC
jgi:hypothetical protein